MTQLHFAISSEDIQSLIKESVDNKIARSILTKVFNQLMEKERDEYLENEAYQRDPDRKTCRNGYYDRAYTTKIGSITLRVPRTRDGKFSTELFERYQRNEKALISTMLEMYVQGVSTRKVRENRRVVSKACHIAIGISEKGKREILGLDISQGETVSSWSNFFEYLKKRGISGLKMVISDSHKDLVRAIKESFTNVSWQRCQAHLIRNILEKSPKKNTEEFRADVKALYKIKDIKLARKVKDEIFNKYEKDKRYEASLKILDEGFENSICYLSIRNSHSRLKTTNCLERLNQEIRRGEKVIRIIPNVDSAIRLISSPSAFGDQSSLTSMRIS